MEENTLSNCIFKYNCISERKIILVKLLITKILNVRVKFKLNHLDGVKKLFLLISNFLNIFSNMVKKKKKPEKNVCISDWNNSNIRIRLVLP